MNRTFLALVLAAAFVFPLKGGGRAFADPAKVKYLIHGVTYDVLTRKAACSIISKDKPAVVITVSFSANISPDTPERDIKRALMDQLRSILTDAGGFEGQSEGK